MDEQVVDSERRTPHPPESAAALAKIASLANPVAPILSTPASYSPTTKMASYVAPRAHLRRLYRRAADWLLRHQGEPQSIARGFAIGLFVALTPTVGIQMVLGGLIAHAFRANRAVAIALAWITNPLTIGPVYYFNYRVGLLLVPGDEARGREFITAIGDASLTRPEEWWSALALMGQELWGVAGVLWVGSLVVATVAAAIAYPLVLRIVIAERARLERFRALPSLTPPPPVDPG